MAVCKKLTNKEGKEFLHNMENAKLESWSEFGEENEAALHYFPTFTLRGSLHTEKLIYLKCAAQWISHMYPSIITTP